MKLVIYQVDAFAEKPFEGNPAAVIPLASWLPDALMQAIAEENNLAETAFFVPSTSGYHIRWFTPTTEVKLCGHATLASAYVLYNCMGHEKTSITFDSLSGPLPVTQDGSLLTLDFPAQPAQRCEIPEALVLGLGLEPVECFRHEDYLVVLDNEQQLQKMKPDYHALEQLDGRGVIVTAPSKTFDFLVRFFAPKCGVPEDPVTGSAYTQLAPYWADRLGQTQFKTRQISPRGGNVHCEIKDDRVLISGSAVLYLQGQIETEAIAQ